ncbi:MAG: hypothetical protein IPP14_09585 [Planctomycetes bacterium]|nr:hypothetical protein [Planctomycetota bacterium]
MDKRAQVEGEDRIREACAAYARVAALAKALPSAFSKHDHMFPEDLGKLLVGLCKGDYAYQVRELKSAYATARAYPQELKLTYMHPSGAGKIIDCQWTVRFQHGNLDQPLAKLDKVLATLCTDIQAFERACNLADELETAVKACPSDDYGKPARIGVDTLRDHRRTYLERAQRELAESTQGIIGAAEWIAKADGLFEGNGLLAGIAKAWSEVPQAVATPSKARKVRRQEPLADRVRTAMFGLHKDQQDYSTKTAVAKRMGVGKSMLNKPEAAQAFNETIQLLRSAPAQHAGPRKASSQARLRGEKERAERDSDD